MLGIGEVQREGRKRAAIVLLISSPCLQLKLLLLVFMQASVAVQGLVYTHTSDLVSHTNTSSPHMARDTGGADSRWPSGKPHQGTLMRG